MLPQHLLSSKALKSKEQLHCAHTTHSPAYREFESTEILQAKLTLFVFAAADLGFTGWVVRVIKLLFDGLTAFDRYRFWHRGGSYLCVFPTLSYKDFKSIDFLFPFFKVVRTTFHKNHVTVEDGGGAAVV